MFYEWQPMLIDARIADASAKHRGEGGTNVEHRLESVVDHRERAAGLILHGLD